MSNPIWAHCPFQLSFCWTMGDSQQHHGVIGFFWENPIHGVFFFQVKVHQWITLTREHATRAVDMWQKGVMHFGGRRAGWAIGVVDVVGVKTFCWICATLKSPEFLEFCETTVFSTIKLKIVEAFSTWKLLALDRRAQLHTSAESLSCISSVSRTRPRHNFMSYFKMNSLAWNNMLDNNFADNRNWGCLDEFWYVTALYGTMKKVHTTGDQSIELPEFTGSPLRIDKAAGWQGKCPSS